MLAQVLESNPFYRRKLDEAGIKQSTEIQTLEDYHRLPFTTKDELSADGKTHAPYGTNLTFPANGIIRIIKLWHNRRAACAAWTPKRVGIGGRAAGEAVYNAAGVTSSDRIFFAFSFGPFIGFWSAYEGARRLAHCLFRAAG